MFGQEMKNRYLDKPIILLADNLRCHQTLRSLETAEKMGIALQMLAPNASHFLQPLDNTLFAAYKVSLQSNNDFSELEGALTLFNARFSNSLCSCVPSAFHKAFTVQNIRRAFENTGIWPYSHHKIMENALENTQKHGPWTSIDAIPSSIVRESFEMAYRANSKTLAALRSLHSSTFTVAVPKKTQSKEDTAQKLFAKTKGTHKLMLEHEREKDAKKKEAANLTAERKRKREEAESESTQHEKRRRQEEDTEEERWSQHTCRSSSCRYVWRPNLKRASSWLVCDCQQFCLCTMHQTDSQCILNFKAHQLLCKQTGAQ